MTTVTEIEPVTVVDLATPPLWHARRVTAGAAANATEALAALRDFGLMPDQLAGESAHLLELDDFDKARALLEETNNEEESMATAIDIAPDIDTSPAAIRTWAKGERLRVASMGKVPQAIENAYLAAHGVPIAEQARIARPTAPGLDDLPIAVGEAPVTPEPGAASIEPDGVTPGPDPVTVEELREQLDRLGAGYTDAVTKLNAAHAQVERLQGQSAQDLAKWNMQVTAQADELERLRHALAESREANNREVVVELPTVVATLPGLLPEEIVDLNDAWHQLFGKATDLGTPAGYTLAEITAPALVREAADRIHDLIRLLDGDVTR